MGNYFYRSCTSRVRWKLTEIIVTHYENNRNPFSIQSFVTRWNWQVEVEGVHPSIVQTMQSAVSGICSGEVICNSRINLVGKWIAKHPTRIRLHDLNWTPRTCERNAQLWIEKFQNFLCGLQLFSRRNRWPRSRCEHRMQNNFSLRSSISWVLRCYWPVISWNCTSVDPNAPVRWNYNFSFFLFHSQQNSIIKLISMGRAFSGILFSLF